MLLKHRNKKFVGGVVGLILLTGCQNVEPWERDRLAEPAMQLISDVAERKRDQQIFSVKKPPAVVPVPLVAVAGVTSVTSDKVFSSPAFNCSVITARLGGYAAE